MSRTTIDIDAPILDELKRLQKEEGKSFGKLVSELVAEALGRRRADSMKKPFKWNAANMGVPLVDLEDKEAVRRRKNPLG